MQMTNYSIGYALPSPLLGLPLSDIPVSPWESYTICSADNCEENAAVSIVLCFNILGYIVLFVL